MNILKYMTKADKVLNLSILILAFSIWIFPLSGFVHKAEKKAIIEFKQQKLYTIDLNKENGIYQFSFGSNKGTYEIRDGSIRLLEMPKEICPNGICSDTGWIQYPGQVIVCSPNQLIVKIQEDSNTQNDIDEISY